MVKATNFEIKLESSEATYKPGETINGSVDFNLNQEIEIKSVRVQFNGATNVHWAAEILVKNEPKPSTPQPSSSISGESSEDQSKSSSNSEWQKKTVVNYDAAEEWFNSSFVLLTNQAGSTLSKGSHSFKFQFILPQNIPASFQHSVGSVSYSIEAFIDNWNETQKIQRSFLVNHFFDLNTDQTLSIAYGNTAKKEFCCDILQCRNEPVIANFSVEKSGYIPGQTLIFNVSIDNKSSRAITTTSVTLYKNIIFRALDESQSNKANKTVKLEIASIKLPREIASRDKDKWQNQSLPIPINCIPSMQHSKIIKTNYELVLRFGAGGFTTSVDCVIPIVIGTVPFACDDCSGLGFTDLSDSPPSYEEALRQTPSAPPQEASWTDSLMFWK